MESVVIAVPTYRRPELLARLLRSLRHEVADTGVLLVLGDNDPDRGDAERVVDSSDLRDACEVACIPVRQPGVAEVRNALVRAATRLRPGWEWLVMLDDDGHVPPGWLTTITTAAREGGADVTAGPVLGDLPAGASRLAHNSLYAGRTRHPSGPVAMLNGAQNIVVRRRILERIGDPWFPTHLGRAGGEDHFFFRAVLDQGGTLAWCDEAPVTEPTPADRLTAGALLRRAYRSNLVGTQTDLAFHGPVLTSRRLAVDAGWLLRKTASAAVRRDRDGLAEALLGSASIAGRAAGFVRRTPPDASHTGC
ncbi:glycosyltransferase [Mobilicoccus pelagius]|nr:glycosyltransferase [Mobilicoccus pelagius]